MFPSTDIVHHFHPIAWVAQMKLLEKQTGKCFCNRDFTVDDVKKIVKTITTKEEIWTGITENCPIKDKSFETLTDELNRMFKKYNINDCIQKIAFLAQVSAETGLFRQTIEEKSRYLSSQSTYKGRGIIQLTGDKDDTGYYNKSGVYKKYANYINDQSIISSPNKIAEDVHYAIDSAGWYFSKYKKIPTWSSTKGNYASNNKKKRNHFKDALGKSLNETSLLINQNSKYFWLQSKIINGYSLSHYLEKNPNGWEHRLLSFNKLSGLFKLYTECINNPNRLDLSEKAPWLKYAYGELYVQAWKPKNNPRISEYFNATTNLKGKDDNTNWCGAFTSWCVREADITPPKISARAAMWQLWKQIPEPIYGAFGVIDNGENDAIDITNPIRTERKYGGAGHITIIVGKSEDGTRLFCLGGNQGGTSGKRFVNISSRKKTDFDWFVIPPDYTPKKEEYTLPIMKNTNDINNMTDENTRN